MQLIQSEVPENYELILMGDTHEGSSLQHRGGLQECLDYVMEAKNRFLVHLGDEVEAIMTDDPRYDPDTCKTHTPAAQKKAVIAQFRPIAPRILAWMWGNHPQKLYRYGNITQEICEELKIPYGTWSAKVTFRDDKGIQFKGFFAHGFRGGLASAAKDHDQKQANLKASLKQKLKEKAGDCILMGCGHYHRLLFVEPARRLYLVDDGKKIKQKYMDPGQGGNGYIDPDSRWYFCSGSFLKNFELGLSSYAEIAGYDPTEIGFIVVEVKNRNIVGIRKVVV